MGRSRLRRQGQVRRGLFRKFAPANTSFIKLPPKSFIPAMRLDGEASYRGDELKLASLAVKFKQGTASASGIVRRLGSAKPIPISPCASRWNCLLSKSPSCPSPFAALPADFVMPAMRLDGGVRAHGDDLTLEKVVIKGKNGTLSLDGVVAKGVGRRARAEPRDSGPPRPSRAQRQGSPFPRRAGGARDAPSRWDANLSYTPRAVRLRKLAVKIASNEISIEGGVTDPSGRAAFDLLSNASASSSRN